MKGLVRDLLERILPSSPEHESTGLESVRIIHSRSLSLVDFDSFLGLHLHRKREQTKYRLVLLTVPVKTKMIKK